MGVIRITLCVLAAYVLLTASAAAAPCAEGASAPSSTRPPLGGLSFDDLASAYDFKSAFDGGVNGSGVTVGVAGLFALHTDDVDAFKRCYGLNSTVTRVPVGDPVPVSQTGNEAQLDVETVMGLAPGANVLFYEGSTTLAILTKMVADDRASVLSFSFGKCENSSAADRQAITAQLQTAAMQGQSVVFSSGDSGSAGCYDETDANPNTKPTVSVFAAQPMVTAVGGTTLYATDGANKVAYATGRAPQEGVWNRGVIDGEPSGTGGGISSKFAMPDYQAGAAAALDVSGGGSGTPCAATTGLCREIPDVSADGSSATGYRIFSQGAWKTVGGTSASAPLWAALFAVANSSPSCGGHTVGFANPALYELAGTRYTANFTDITLPDPFSGFANNDALGVNGGAYPVKAGYDMATGLGSPKVPALVAGLCNGGATDYTVTVADPGPQTAAAGTSTTLRLTATDSGRALVRFGAAGLPPGLALDPTGAVTGTPTTPGAYDVTVTGTDVQGNAAQRAFRWTIMASTPPPPVAARLSATRVRVAVRPTAGFTVTGTDLTRIVVMAPKGVSPKAGAAVTGADGKPLAAQQSARGRRLTVRLAAPASVLRVLLPKGSLHVSRKVRRRIMRHEVKALRFGVAVTDVVGTVKTLRF